MGEWPRGQHSLQAELKEMFIVAIMLMFLSVLFHYHALLKCLPCQPPFTSAADSWRNVRRPSTSFQR